MRDFATKIDNTAPSSSGVLTADEDNVRFREMESMASTAGITLDGAAGPDTDITMLAQAMARYASGGVVCRDAGAANTHVLTTFGQFVLAKAYFKGMLVMFYPAGTNTGAATANFNGIGPKQIYNCMGSELAAGDIVVSALTMMIYDTALNGGAGAFKLSPWSMPMRSVGDGTPVYEGMAGGRHKVRSLMAGANITIDLVESPPASGEYKIRITSAGGGGGGTLTDGDKGDIVVTSTATVWTIDSKAVTNSKLADMPANTFKARRTTLGEPEDITGSQAASILPTAAIGTKGLVTPNGNAAQYYNGAGAFATPALSFALYPDPGSYTMRTYQGSTSGEYLGTTKSATGVGSWAALLALDLPSGFWQLTANPTIIDGRGGGSSGDQITSLLMFLRTS